MARENGTRESMLDRRSYLRLAGSAAATVAGGATATGTAAADNDCSTDSSALSGLRGAIYWPARAYNHYQTWADYGRREIERDFSYAADLNLDALRLIVGWEFWRDEPAAFRRAFDHLLATADARDLRILPVLFESIGATPTAENVADDGVLTSFAVRSPSHAVLQNESRWGGPRQFVEWFTERYGDRDAVVALEIMNEPGEWTPRVEFCRAMLRAARDADASVPLTMGTKDLSLGDLYADPGLDAYQFHHNLPKTTAEMERQLREAERFSEEADAPVWLTEWQRTRTPEPPNRMLPNYSSLASTISDSDVDGDFFWQLMLKPAYIEKPRKMGRLNGLVHEDGAVYSAEDARAIASGGARASASEDAQAIASDDREWTERREWPDWAAPAERRWAPCSGSSSPETCSQG